MTIQELPHTGHPLADTAARFVWLLPLLPLLGFVINGSLALSAVWKTGPADPSAGGHGHADAPAHAHHDDAHADVDHHVVRHKYAGIVNLVGPGVLVATFGLALAIFAAMAEGVWRSSGKEVSRSSRRLPALESPDILCEHRR